MSHSKSTINILLSLLLSLIYVYALFCDVISFSRSSARLGVTPCADVDEVDAAAHRVPRARPFGGCEPPDALSAAEAVGSWPREGREGRESSEGHGEGFVLQPRRVSSGRRGPGGAGALHGEHRGGAPGRSEDGHRLQQGPAPLPDAALEGPQGETTNASNTLEKV